MKKKSPKILFVDDEVSVLNCLKRFISDFDWQCEFAPSGSEALELIEKTEFDVVVSDMRMPQMTGATLLKRVREISPDTVRILLTGYSDTDCLLVAVNDAKVFNYITKPWDDNLLIEILESAVTYRQTVKHNQSLQRTTQEQNSLLVQLNGSLEQKVTKRTQQLRCALAAIEKRNLQLNDSFDNIVAMLGKLVEHKENKSTDDRISVSELCVAVAQQLHLKEDEIESLRIAGLLRNIGTLGLSFSMDQKARNLLTKTELEDYQSHPIIAETILAGVGNMDDVGEIIRLHCERMDGSGFPEGLRGDQVPLAAKTLGVVSDYYDLAQGRIDDVVVGANAALTYLQNHSAEKYDQSVVNTLKHVISNIAKSTNIATTVTSGQLVPDMRLASDLVSETGLLLLSKGKMITSSVIEKLRRYEKEAKTKLSVNIELEQSITVQSLPFDQLGTTQMRTG